MPKAMEREYELQTHRAEDRHWWYRGRRRVIVGLIEGLHLPAGARILDAGCGSGRNMVELSRFGEVTGVELSSTSVALARARNVGEVLEVSVMDMPFPDGHFTLATSLDVIEHLEDDVGALRELRRVVAPGGHLLLAVPSYQWLWSGHDVLNQHHRRYNNATLLSACAAAGWRCGLVSHFNSLLLPVAIMLRALDRVTPKATESSLDLWVPPRPLNWALELPLDLEARAISRGRSIPAGLSLLALLS
jgi:SAM-dependent methyltransferase